MRDLQTALTLIMGALLGSVGCTPAPAAQTQPPPQFASATPVTGAGAVTAPQGAGGSIIGSVATNPWRAIKTGGVVFLEDAPKDTSHFKSATLDNHDMQFDPLLVIVSAGGSLVFTNTDPILHNAFTPDGDKWDLGDIPQFASVARRFDTPARYTILCHRHAEMIAFLVVTPSTFFARVDAEGAYTIKGVPPGTYHVTAWVPRLGPVTKEVTVREGEVTANFDLER